MTQVPVLCSMTIDYASATSLPVTFQMEFYREKKNDRQWSSAQFVIEVRIWCVQNHNWRQARLQCCNAMHVGQPLC